MTPPRGRVAGATPAIPAGSKRAVLDRAVRTVSALEAQARTTDSESASGLTHLQKAGSFLGPLVFYRVCKQDSFFREMKWQLDAADQANPVTAQMRVPGAL